MNKLEISGYKQEAQVLKERIFHLENVNKRDKETIEALRLKIATLVMANVAQIFIIWTIYFNQ